MKNKTGARVLFIDIETSPLLVYCWGLFDQNIGLNQIKEDWAVLSWAAKWRGESQVMYMDNSKSRNVRNDKAILKQVWKLLDEAEIIVTQNGIAFDAKKLNARFIQNGMTLPSPYKHLDTLKIAKRNFAFTSNKLAYMTGELCSKYKKLEHSKFPGFELWKECLKGNKAAWKEMKEYNIHDVLALEELYEKLAHSDNSVNFNLYSDSLDVKCNCGSSNLQRRGLAYTTTGRFQRYQCLDCGKWTRGTKNLLSKKKKATLRK